jgi:hypothetical protein
LEDSLKRLIETSFSTPQKQAFAGEFGVAGQIDLEFPESGIIARCRDMA